jgi:hypothetical protein
MTQDVAKHAERVRDLKSQIEGLGPGDKAEILFQEISPGRAPVTIYSTENGEPIPIPAYMVPAVMGKTLPDGSFMFVADKKNAPEFKLGTVKCFMHPNSPEQVIMPELGISKPCEAEHLGSLHSKRIHAEHRHRQEWAAYQEFVTDEKERKAIERQDKQLEATLAIARGNSPRVEKAALVSCDIEGCDYKGTKRQMSGHRMGAHK